MIALHGFTVLLKFPLCTFDGDSSQLLVFLIAPQPGDVTRPGLAGTLLHKIFRSKMAVVPDNDHLTGPLFAKVPNYFLSNEATLFCLFLRPGFKIVVISFPNNPS